MTLITKIILAHTITRVAQQNKQNFQQKGPFKNEKEKPLLGSVAIFSYSLAAFFSSHRNWELHSLSPFFFFFFAMSDQAHHWWPQVFPIHTWEYVFFLWRITMDNGDHDGEGVLKRCNIYIYIYIYIYMLCYVLFKTVLCSY